MVETTDQKSKSITLFAEEILISPHGKILHKVFSGWWKIIKCEKNKWVKERVKKNLVLAEKFHQNSLKIWTIFSIKRFLSFIKKLPLVCDDYK